MQIAIGSDHAGFRYKEAIKKSLIETGHDLHDFGTHDERPVDYPLFIRPIAEIVAIGGCERGIVLGGSGNGAGCVGVWSPPVWREPITTLTCFLWDKGCCRWI